MKLHRDDKGRSERAEEDLYDLLQVLREYCEDRAGVTSRVMFGVDLPKKVVLVTTASRVFGKRAAKPSTL